MLSIKTALLATATALLSGASADYYINPDSVSLSSRSAWCASEISSCPLICSQSSPYSTNTLDNTCDVNTLRYGCVCSDGKQPNVSEYSLTLPFFVCQEWGNQCVTACGNDNQCANDCREKHPCGALSPTPANKTASESASTSTASSTSSASDAIYSNFGDSGSSSSSSSGSSGSSSTSQSGVMPTFNVQRAMVMVATLGGLTAGFALFL